MSSEVTKLAVVDPRIVQTKPKYAVEKGAMSITNTAFTAIGNSSTQQTFNIQVPSENVFVDRAIQWNASAIATFTVTMSGTTPTNEPILVIGRDLALAPFPTQQAVSTLTAAINDTTVTINMSDVLPQVLRLSDTRECRRQRTCPTKLDNYAVYPYTDSVINSPLQSYSACLNSDESPNGAYGRFQFCDSTGADLVEGVYYDAATSTKSSSQASAATNWVVTKGQPTSGSTAMTSTTVVFYVKWTTTEKLVLSPFVFRDDAEWATTGLFGIQNIQVTANLIAPTRSIRFMTPTALGSSSITRTVTTLPAWATGSNLPFPTSKLNVQFLTPALDVPLPPKSIVPYMEYPRYISPAATVAACATSGSGYVGQTPTVTALTSQTITLPCIPDFLCIYVKPSAYTGASGAAVLAGGSSVGADNADWVFPINSCSLNFDNFSGLLSSHTQEELYQMSVNNGVDMDWNEWAGLGKLVQTWNNGKNGGATTSGSTAATIAENYPLVGGPLVLRPGRDFALQAGQAPGLVGNFTLQFQLGVNSFLPTAISAQIYVMAINSGFFETIKGSSRIIKGVLTEQDILGAAATGNTPELDRTIGEGIHHAAHRKSHMKKHHKMSAYC